VRPVTFLKIGAAVLGGLALMFALGALLAYESLKDPPFDPLALAPLGKSPTLHLDKLVEADHGYVVAGMLGTSDPHRGTPCSGRPALVWIDQRGRAERAVLLSILESSRYCADRIEALLPDGDGGWLVTGHGVRDGGPSGLFPGKPSTDFTTFTARFDAAGNYVESFGDDGVVEDLQLGGRSDRVLFTDDIERVTDDGEVRDDLVTGAEEFAFWRWLLVEDDLLVAVEHGGDLKLQTFERGDAPVVHYRPLQAPPAVVELGPTYGFDDMVLAGGVVYAAVRDRVGLRINAVDPVQARIAFAFNGTGAVRLPGYATDGALAVDRSGRIVAASTVIERGRHGDRLQVQRVAASGVLDESFGGRIARRGRDVLLDPGVDAVLVDTAGRTVVLGGEAKLVRLTPSGRLDPTFGDAGVVDTRRLDVCRLPPARAVAACRE
jgi:hypothetical protein